MRFEQDIFHANSQTANLSRGLKTLAEKLGLPISIAPSVEDLEFDQQTQITIEDEGDVMAPSIRVEDPKTDDEPELEENYFT